jgi:hypothetical protein
VDGPGLRGTNSNLACGRQRLEGNLQGNLPWTRREEGITGERYHRHLSCHLRFKDKLHIPLLHHNVMDGGVKGHGNGEPGRNLCYVQTADFEAQILAVKISGM